MRYRKRRYRAPARRRLPIGAIVGIVAAAALLTAIVAGNILNSCLDDETYRRLTEGETTEEATESATPSRTAPRVTAQPFRLGNSLRALGDDPPSALALPINHSSGELLYRSPVVEYLGRAVAEDAAQNAERSMSSLLDTVPYLIGIWQVRLPNSSTNESVLQAAAETDAAILREFLSMGGSELLLVGLDWEDGFETSYAYLTALAERLDERTVLSVAVPLQTATSELGRDVLFALDRLLPFLTLDLTDEADVGLPTDNGAETDKSETDQTDEPTEQSPLRTAAYYLNAYGMRLLLAESQTNLLRSAAETAPDLAVLATSAG